MNFCTLNLYSIISHWFVYCFRSELIEYKTISFSLHLKIIDTTIANTLFNTPHTVDGKKLPKITLTEL